MLLVGVALAACLAVVIVHGIHSRVQAESSLAKITEANAVLAVRAAHPKLGAPTEELVLPGNIEAFTDTPIYARTNGYLRHWYVDIGAHVKAGELLAEIETPEVDQQLSQARAQLATAQADYKLAKTTAERWQDLRKTDSVAQQDTDEKTGDMESKNATMEAARANVRRLEEMQSFQKIYAPFAGVITARNIDIGDLINEGSNGTARELFHLAAINMVRVYVEVPQVSARAALPGTVAELTVPERPGQQFAGKIVRTANAINQASRTMRVEVDVDNPGGVLVPGAYSVVHLKMPNPVSSVIVPVSGILFRSEGMTVAVVEDGKVRLQPVAVGRDFGDELEVVSGLTPDDQIVLNPPDSIAAGQQVRVTAIGAQ